jgi:hypothetical protein
MKNIGDIHISEELYLILDKLRIMELALMYGRKEIDDSMVGAIANMTRELSSQLTAVIDAYTEREIKRVDGQFSSSPNGSSHDHSSLSPR